MSTIIELVQNGSVTSPKGFLAGGTYAGLKSEGDNVLDLGILVSESLANVGATFSTNSVLSPSVTVSKERSRKKMCRGVVANSGCANCAVGEQGFKDALELASLAADVAGVEPDEMLVCSTGMIGVEMPMALIRQNIGNVRPNTNDGDRFAQSIMTTDSHPKYLAISVDIGGRKITLGGAAKGVGMVHPNMATMLAFISTDASVEQEFLQNSLGEAVSTSFNMIDIDGDQSTNDTVLIFANGAAGGPMIEQGTHEGSIFQEALTYICTFLAKELVRDGEGAKKLIHITVDGAKSLPDARKASREIASSLLVKAMVHGNDPNWGRIMMALGKSGIQLEESKIDIFINNIQIVHAGLAIPYHQDAVVSSMRKPDVYFKVSLNIGDYEATGWGCDLTEEYVIFNSAYST